jgi:hypothetical protein
MSSRLDGLAWLVLIGGIVSFVIGIKNWTRAKKQLHWMSVPGTITGSEVKYDGELYVPTVTYCYEIGGQQLEGSTVKSGLVSTNWRGPAERICARYAVSTAVRVYVDTHEPSRSVLEPGGDRAFLPLICVVSALLVAVGSVLLWS